MPQYKFRFHGENRWQEISEFELMDSLYKNFRKFTLTIKKMIVGKEVKNT